MEIRQLEYFVAIAEMGSFTRAAQVCNVVQTTVSHSIASLERELGVKLFVRDGHSISLTREGRFFLPDARAIVERTKTAEQSLNRLRTSGKATLKVGYYGAGLAEDFPEVLRRFRAETGADVELRGADAQASLDDLAPEVKRGALDAFIIAHAPIAEHDVWAEQEIVAFNHVYLAMSVDDDLALPGVIDRCCLKGVASTICMFRASRLERYVSAMRSWLADGFGVDSSLVSWNDSMEDTRLLARCGQCRTILFRNSCRDYFSEDGLVFRRIEGTGDLPITMIWDRAAGGENVKRFAEVARKVSSDRGIDVQKTLRIKGLSKGK